MRALVFGVTVLLALPSVPALADETDDLARAVDERPEDKAAYDAFAKAALRGKRFDDVIRKVKIGVARMSDYGQGYYWLAVAYRSKREWADAADYYRRYITLNPTKTDPYYGLGASLEGLGDRKGAIAAFEKYVTLEKAPEKQRFVESARAELVKLDPSRAPKGAELPIATELKPQPAPRPRADAPQLRATADQLRREGHIEEAASAYQKAIEADPGNLELHNELGNCWFGLKRYPEAAAAFQKAVDRDPSYALGWYNLAHALRKGDKKAEAVTAYRQYMRLKPDDPDPYYGLAQTLKALGDVPGAIDAFRRYVSMEKRPEEQRWVDKAKAELEALESLQKGSPSGAPGPSGKIRERDSGEELAQAAAEKLRREIEADSLQPFGDDDSTDGTDLKNPFERASMYELKDPFAAVEPGRGDRRGLREYGVALEAFRRALTRQAEDVQARYERGIELALSDDLAGAQRAWNGAQLTDPRVDAARKGVERLRHLLASRK